MASYDEAALEELLFGSGSLVEGGESSGGDDAGLSAFADAGEDARRTEVPRGVKRARSAPADVDDASVEAPDSAAAAAAGADAEGAVAPSGGANGSAWVDEDDATVRVDISNGASRLRKLRRLKAEQTISGTELSDRLRAQFSATNAGAAWGKNLEGGDAEAKAEADDDAAYGGGDADEIFRTTAPLVASSEAGGPLPASLLDVKRDPDGNEAERSKAVIQAVDFHPNGQIMLTAGFDKTLRFFRIDGARNPKLQAVHLRALPIFAAAFTDSGREVIASGRRKYFYTYDLEHGAVRKISHITGRTEKSLESMVASTDGKWIVFLGCDGTAILLSGHSKQWVANLKMNGTIRAAAFVPGDSNSLYTTGGDGEVYRWDLASRVVVGQAAPAPAYGCSLRFRDEGNLGGTAIAVGPASSSMRRGGAVGHALAVGSSSGVVNLYDCPGRGLAPVLRKSVMNLTTAIDSLSFNHDGQMLALSSYRKRDQLKLVHVGTGTVFANWPTLKTPLHYVKTVGFSPHGGYLSVGNDRGKVLIYRLRHYERS
jgi:U3 small nucleolar RNA-associated protein 18